MRILLVLLLLATPGTIALGQEPAAKQPFTIVISTDDLVVKAGSRVLINLQMTNTSNHDLWPGWGGQDNLGVTDVADQIDVRDSHGRQLEKKKRDPRIGRGLGPPTFAMKPGETNGYSQDYSRWYDLTRPGKYTIQVLRPFSENGKKGVVKSNVLTITITP